eukprot:PhM_4_TR17333/c0_g1_i1/m.85319
MKHTFLGFYVFFVDKNKKKRVHKQKPNTKRVSFLLKTFLFSLLVVYAFISFFTSSLVSLLVHVRLAVDAGQIGQLRHVQLEAALHFLEDLTVCEFLTLVDGAHGALVRGDEAHRETLVPEAPGTADAVEVRVGVRRHVVLHDEVDAVDVDAAAEEIRGDEDLGLLRLALVEHGEALRLVHLGVNGNGGELALDEHLVERLAAGDGVDEDDALVEVDGVEHVDELARLLRLLDVDVVLHEAVERELGLLVDVDLQRVVEELLGEVAHLLGHRGGEHHDLLRLRRLEEDGLHVLAHRRVVEALVELVQDEVLHLREVDRAVVGHGGKTAGGADDDERDVLRVLEVLHRLLLGHAAEDDARRAVGEVAVEAGELTVDLVGKLARVHHDDGLHGLGLVVGDLLDVLQQREHEHSGLAHTGLGLGEDIVAEQRLGEGLVLHLAGMLEAVLGDGARELGLEAEVLEATNGERDLHGALGGGSGGGRGDDDVLVELLEVHLRLSGGHFLE